MESKPLNLRFLHKRSQPCQIRTLGTLAHQLDQAIAKSQMLEGSMVPTDWNHSWFGAAGRSISPDRRLTTEESSSPFRMAVSIASSMIGHKYQHDIPDAAACSRANSPGINRRSRPGLGFGNLIFSGLDQGPAPLLAMFQACRSYPWCVVRRRAGGLGIEPQPWNRRFQKVIGDWIFEEPI